MGDHAEGIDDRLLLTPAQCARRLGLGHTTVYSLISSGQIPSFLVGTRARRIPAAALDEWVSRQLASQTRDPEDLRTRGR